MASMILSNSFLTGALAAPRNLSNRFQIQTSLVMRIVERAVRRCTSRYDHVVTSITSPSSISLRKEQMGEGKNRGLGRTKTSEGVSHCLLGLRASTPVVEDDQDIGESNASVTINIGGAVVGHWFTVVARSIFGPSATHLRAVCFSNGSTSRVHTA